MERLAPVPVGLSLEKAAAVPLAGLTALALLRRCGDLIGRRLLVTGARGGVGSLVVQLGKISGAEVTAVARAEYADWLLKLGADKVVSTIADAEGRFDSILESEGGKSLEEAIAHIRSGGRILSFGNTSGTNSTFNMFSFFGAENASLETFFSYRSMLPAETGTDIEYLLGLVANGRLEIQTTVLNWKAVGSALALLEGRETRGKIVLITTESNAAW